MRGRQAREHAHGGSRLARVGRSAALTTGVAAMVLGYRFALPLITPDRA